MARILLLGRYRLTSFASWHIVFEPKLRYMRSIEYWHDNMVRTRSHVYAEKGLIETRSAKRSLALMYMTNHDIRLHSSGRDTYELD